MGPDRSGSPRGGLGSAPGSCSSDYDNFSCDHGTGWSPRKFAGTVYFRSTGAGRAAALYVSLFIPSKCGGGTLA
ncbi:hypothetical protein [Streptomyces sp. KL116D]|uniref:hypothetical protein n=1 Tax=Streptomyces sp. KL116D TaxID=3045152 RepID=UPI003557227B